MEKYRCAIIGCGGRAHGHAKAYQLVDRGDLVACAIYLMPSAAKNLLWLMVLLVMQVQWK